jgi:hypothetical protein
LPKKVSPIYFSSEALAKVNKEFTSHQGRGAEFQDFCTRLFRQNNMFERKGKTAYGSPLETPLHNSCGFLRTDGVTLYNLQGHSPEQLCKD